jgi:hypothetical protein
MEKISQRNVEKKQEKFQIKSVNHYSYNYSTKVYKNTPGLTG